MQTPAHKMQHSYPITGLSSNEQRIASERSPALHSCHFRIIGGLLLFDFMALLNWSTGNLAGMAGLFCHLR
jgi:hypothetical protein